MGISMRMGAIFGYEIDPIISLRVMEQERGYLLPLKPKRAPTEANCRRDMGGVEGPYVGPA